MTHPDPPPGSAGTIRFPNVQTSTRPEVPSSSSHSRTRLQQPTHLVQGNVPGDRHAADFLRELQMQAARSARGLPDVRISFSTWSAAMMPSPVVP